jgi:hypothetical protein
LARFGANFTEFASFSVKGGYGSFY